MVSERRRARVERKKARDLDKDEPCCDWDDERQGALLGGTIMIAIGGIFLANTLGFIPWSLGETMSKLWPVIPIIIGVWLIAKFFIMRN